ncbi:MAG: hypothetical protein HY898_27005 [Deltaproteobacteria bacterium]|nr:hypothetical protein [Deltaproteobacteria bacterium]
MRWKHRAALALGIGVASLAGCSELAPIVRGTCGNGIVEPDNGEDCDGFPQGVCVAPGSQGECRFGCDPSNAAGTCPQGWGCGSDKICRKASKRFAKGLHPSSTPLRRVFPGDFDGDGRSDVVALGADELFVRYFDAADPFGTEVLIRPATVPAVGALTESPTSDFITMSLGGLNVMRGTTDKTFLPTPYSSIPIPAGNTRFVAMDAMPPNILAPGQYYGDEIIVFWENQIVVPGASQNGAKDVILFQSTATAADVLGEIQVADLWVDPLESPCQEIAVAFKGDSKVNVLTPCKRSGAGYVWNDNINALPPVVLEGAPIGSGVIATDLNGDQRVDLLVSDAKLALYAAYGTNGGKFHSDPTQLGSTGLVPDQKFAKVIVQGEGGLLGLPLAAADLTGDGYPELVIGQPYSLVLVSTKLSQPNAWAYMAVAGRDDVHWTQARIADLNSNGIPDILASTDDSPDFDFYNGVGGGLFNYFEIRTNGVPGEIRIGDFDGDLISDVAFADRTPGIHDTLSVLFGNPFGAPGPSVSMGRIGSISGILPMNMVSFGLDAVTDMIVVTKDDSDNQSLAVFSGSSDRQLQSPLRLTRAGLANQSVDALPELAIVGHFNGESGEKRHLDAAAIASEKPDVVTGAGGLRLWLLPSTGEAAIDPATILSSDALPSEFMPNLGLAVAVNLDREKGDDELVMLAPSLAGVDSGMLGLMGIARSKPVDTLHQFALDGPLQATKPAWIGDNSRMSSASQGTKGGTPPGGQGGTADMAGNGAGQIRAVDIDADGLVDVIATGTSIGTEQASRMLIIYRNTGDGKLNAADGFEVANPSKQLIQGFLLVQADDDPERELVILTRDEAWLVQVDLAGKKLVESKQLEDVKGGFDGIAADFDGDGVEDLVIVGEMGIHYHRGIAVLP